MTKTLNYKPEHGLYLYECKEFHDGVRYTFKFDNGFGASVVKNLCSYGHKQDLWELAVIEFYPELDGDWSLTYETDITDDVIGWLNDDEVNALLDRIKNLDKDGHEEVTMVYSKRKETNEDETEQD